MTKSKRLMVEEPPFSMDYQVSDATSSCSSIQSRILRPHLSTSPSQAPRRAFYSLSTRRSPRPQNNGLLQHNGMDTSSPTSNGVLDAIKEMVRKIIPEKWFTSSDADLRANEAEKTHRTESESKTSENRLGDPEKTQLNESSSFFNAATEMDVENETAELIYERLLHRSNRDRISLYRDLARFFRAQNSTPLTRDQFEELSLIIQRQAPLVPLRLPEQPIITEPLKVADKIATEAGIATLSTSTALAQEAIRTPQPSPRPPVLKPTFAVTTPRSAFTTSQPSIATALTRSRRRGPHSKARIFSARFEDAELELLEQMDWKREMQEQRKVEQLLGTTTNRQKLAEEARRRMAEQLRQSQTQQPASGFQSTVGQSAGSSLIQAEGKLIEGAVNNKFEFTIPPPAASAPTRPTINAPPLMAPTEIPKLVFDFEGVGETPTSKPATAKFNTVPSSATFLSTIKEEPKEEKSTTLPSMFTFGNSIMNTTKRTTIPQNATEGISLDSEKPLIKSTAPITENFTFGTGTAPASANTNVQSSFGSGFTFGSMTKTEPAKEVSKEASISKPPLFSFSIPTSAETETKSVTQDTATAFSFGAPKPLPTTDESIAVKKVSKPPLFSFSAIPSTKSQESKPSTEPTTSIEGGFAPGSGSSVIQVAGSGLEMVVEEAPSAAKKMTFGSITSSSSDAKPLVPGTPFTFGLPPTNQPAFTFGSTIKSQTFNPPTIPSSGTSDTTIATPPSFGFGFGGSNATNITTTTSQPSVSGSGFTFGGAPLGTTMTSTTSATTVPVNATTQPPPSTSTPTTFSFGITPSTTPTTFSFGSGMSALGGPTGEAPSLFSAPPPTSASMDGQEGESRRFSKPISRRRR